MRSVVFSVILAANLGACATVSMVSSEATVETGISAEQSSLRKVSDAYIDMAERKNWVTKSSGILGFARVLMDGVSGDDEPEKSVYLSEIDGEPSEFAQAERLRTDIEGATHGLNVATMEAQKLFGTGATAKSLRADLVSYESALVTAKKARRTFVTTLADLEIDGASQTATALNQFDISIDAASNAADKLADYAALRKQDEATS